MSKPTDFAAVGDGKADTACYMVDRLVLGFLSALVVFVVISAVDLRP